MNEFFHLAAKIASDKRLQANNYGLNLKVAGETWDKIKNAAGKAWGKTKDVANSEHFKKGAASAAIGGATYIGGRMGGLSRGKAAGAGIGAAAAAEGAQYAKQGYGKAKELISNWKANRKANREQRQAEATERVSARANVGTPDVNTGKVRGLDTLLPKKNFFPQRRPKNGPVNDGGDSNDNKKEIDPSMVASNK